MFPSKVLISLPSSNLGIQECYVIQTLIFEALTKLHSFFSRLDSRRLLSIVLSFDSFSCFIVSLSNWKAQMFLTSFFYV